MRSLRHDRWIAQSVAKHTEVEAIMDLLVSSKAGIIIPGQAAVSKFGVSWARVASGDHVFERFVKGSESKPAHSARKR